MPAHEVAFLMLILQGGTSVPSAYVGGDGGVCLGCDRCLEEILADLLLVVERGEAVELCVHLALADFAPAQSLIEQ